MRSAVLLLKCKDAPRVTQLKQESVMRAMNAVVEFFRQQSGGRERLTYRVFDWLELSLTGSEWDELGFNVGPDISGEVASALQINWAAYDHFVLVIDKEGARLGATGGTLKYCHIAASDLTQALLAHEISHTFGANHANLGAPDGPVEYGDPFCIMGAEGGKYSFMNPALGDQGASGPGMAAPALIACGWLDVSDSSAIFDVGRQTTPRPNEPLCEIAALRGAPPDGHSGLPVIAIANDIAGGQDLIVEFRMRESWDQAIPASGSAPGWIVAHLTSGTMSQTTSLQIGAAPAEVGTRLNLPSANMSVTVAAVDSSLGTVSLQVEKPWFAYPSGGASWTANRLDVFGIGADWQMYHKAWDGTGWHPTPTSWEGLGGSFLSPPTAVTWGPNRLDVLALGRNRALYHKGWDGNNWQPSTSGWESLGGKFTCPPAAAAWGPNRLDIFGIGVDRQMYHKAWTGHTWLPSLSDWEALGGRFTSPPSVVSWGSNRLDIFALGDEGAMYHKAWDGDHWYPSLTGWALLGGRFISPPEVVAWGPNRLDIFGLGTDGAMYHKAWDGNNWYPSQAGWERIGGRFTHAPSAVSWGANRLDIFGIGTDGAMYHKAWDGSSWYPPVDNWEALGGKFVSRPLALSWSNNRLDLFGYGTDKAMYHRAWDGTVWHPWEYLGGNFA